MTDDAVQLSIQIKVEDEVTPPLVCRKNPPGYHRLSNLRYFPWSLHHFV